VDAERLRECLPDRYVFETRKRMDVLIIEDDDPIADVIAEALHEEGYQPRVATNVQEALAAIHAQVPQAILLDLYLPTPADSALVLAYWRDVLAQAVPLIVMTASPHTLSIAVTEVLVKPFDLEALITCVQRHQSRAAFRPAALAVAGHHQNPGGVVGIV